MRIADFYCSLEHFLQCNETGWGRFVSCDVVDTSLRLVMGMSLKRAQFIFASVYTFVLQINWILCIFISTCLMDRWCCYSFSHDIYCYSCFLLLFLYLSIFVTLEIHCQSFSFLLPSLFDVEPPLVLSMLHFFIFFLFKSRYVFVLLSCSKSRLL